MAYQKKKVYRMKIRYKKTVVLGTASFLMLGILGCGGISDIVNPIEEIRKTITNKFIGIGLALGVESILGETTLIAAAQSGLVIAGNEFDNDQLQEAINNNLQNIKIQNPDDLHPTTIWAVEYNTTDKKGRSIPATGLMAIPDTDPETKNPQAKPRAIVLSMYAKKFYDSGVFPAYEGDPLGDPLYDQPSESVTQIDIRMEPLLFSARSGDILIVPDYIGLGQHLDFGGSNPEQYEGVENRDENAKPFNFPHPYLVKDAYAKTGVDMIRSTIAFCLKKGFDLNGQIYITGLAEGANAAIAVAKALEETPINGFNVMGVAPISGPYNVKATYNDGALTTDIKNEIKNAYTAYFGNFNNNLLVENSVENTILRSNTRYYNCEEISHPDTKPTNFNVSDALDSKCAQKGYTEVSDLFMDLYKPNNYVVVNNLVDKEGELKIKAIKFQHKTVSDRDNNKTVDTYGILRYQKNSIKKRPIVLHLHSLYFVKDQYAKFDNGAYAYAQNGLYDDDFSSNRTESIFFAGLDDAVIASPDYIGIGSKSESPHPYLVKDLLGKTTYNMLEATIDYCKKNNIPLNGDVYIAGLGEGAIAAASVAEFLQDYPIDGFNIKKIATLDGPFDLIKAFVNVDDKEDVAMDLLDSYNQYYGLNAKSIHDQAIQTKLMDNSVATNALSIDKYSCQDDKIVNEKTFNYTSALSDNCSYAFYDQLSKQWFH